MKIAALEYTHRGNALGVPSYMEGWRVLYKFSSVGPVLESIEVYVYVEIDCHWLAIECRRSEPVLLDGCDDLLVHTRTHAANEPNVRGSAVFLHPEIDLRIVCSNGPDVFLAKGRLDGVNHRWRSNRAADVHGFGQGRFFVSW